MEKILKAYCKTIKMLYLFQEVYKFLYFRILLGYEEASLTSRKDYCLYVRKGFIKYGLKYGYNLYPSFIFNENKLYNYLEGFGKLKLLLNKLKIPGIIPYSKFGIFPYRDVEV